MHQQTTYSPAVQQLFTLGRPDPWREREDGEEKLLLGDYVDRFGFSAEDVPELIRLAKVWAERQSEEEFDEVADYAPLHAWRVLGELQAEEAIQPLIELMVQLDQVDDDWFIEMLPNVFGAIGPVAMEPLARSLEDRTRSQYVRDVAASGMAKVAESYPEFRAQVVEKITAVLDRHEEEAWEFNGFLVSRLLEMNAVESAESIERAFSAGIVDEGILGNWDYVKEKMGVEGLGLPMPDNAFNSISQYRQMHYGDGIQDAKRAELRKKKKRRDKAKAKRKQKAKAAKRNRRAK